MARLLAILKQPQYPSTPLYLITPRFFAQIDASGTWGCVAVLGSQLLQWQWPPEWYEIGIMAKELVPITFTCVVWTQHPATIPSSAFRLISPHTLDWIPSSFLQLFQMILSCIY